MKLLFCQKCENVFRLTKTPQDCPCGGCGGVYTDDLQAQFWGDAIPLGFDNASFHSALANQPEEPESGGRQFTAFVVEKGCPTFERVTFELVERASDPQAD